METQKQMFNIHRKFLKLLGKSIPKYMTTISQYLGASSLPLSYSKIITPLLTSSGKFKTLISQHKNLAKILHILGSLPTAIYMVKKQADTASKLAHSSTDALISPIFSYDLKRVI